jgi:hypothetical protein
VAGEEHEELVVLARGAVGVAAEGGVDLVAGGVADDPTSNPYRRSSPATASASSMGLTRSAMAGSSYSLVAKRSARSRPVRNAPPPPSDDGGGSTSERVGGSDEATTLSASLLDSTVSS